MCGPKMKDEFEGKSLLQKRLNSQVCEKMMILRRLKLYFLIQLTIIRFSYLKFFIDMIDHSMNNKEHLHFFRYETNSEIG